MCSVMCVCKNKQSGKNRVRPGVHKRAILYVTHSVHVNAVSVGPSMLKILLQPLPEWVGDLVETDELPNSQHLSVVTRGAGIQPLDDG